MNKFYDNLFLFWDIDSVRIKILINQINNFRSYSTYSKYTLISNRNVLLSVIYIRLHVFRSYSNKS